MGDFSVWEFSGNPVYHCCYDYFAADDVTAIHLVLFSLEEPYETQLGHATYWLNQLKALTLPQDSIGPSRSSSSSGRRPAAEGDVSVCLSVFGGRIPQPLAVVLVATHADLAGLPRAFSGEFSYDKERALLKEVRNRWDPNAGSDSQLVDEEVHRGLPQVLI